MYNRTHIWPLPQAPRQCRGIPHRCDGLSRGRTCGTGSGRDRPGDPGTVRVRSVRHGTGPSSTTEHVRLFRLGGGARIRGRNAVQGRRLQQDRYRGYRRRVGSAAATTTSATISGRSAASLLRFPQPTWGNENDRHDHRLRQAVQRRPTPAGPALGAISKILFHWREQRPRTDSDRGPGGCRRVGAAPRRFEARHLQPGPRPAGLSRPTPVRCRQVPAAARHRRPDRGHPDHHRIGPGP